MAAVNLGGPFTDPSQLTLPPPGGDPAPLQLLELDDLVQIRSTLSLACGRSKTALNKKRRAHICLMIRVLDLEKARRDSLIA